MKIYFEDNWLVPVTRMPKHDFVLNAGAGISINERLLDGLLRTDPNCTLYTNSFVALDNTYCWNQELGVPELYIRPRPNADFVRVDELTDMELRRPHNLLALYRNGAFTGKRKVVRDGFE